MAPGQGTLVEPPYNICNKTAIVPVLTPEPNELRALTGNMVFGPATASLSGAPDSESESPVTAATHGRTRKPQRAAEHRHPAPLSAAAVILIIIIVRGMSANAAPQGAIQVQDCQWKPNFNADQT